MRTVLWDMDGTLSDSENVHFLAWEATLERYEITYPYDQFIADFGRSNGDLLPELLDIEPGSEMVRTVAHEKETSFRQLARKAGLQPLPGVTHWLERFQSEGVAQVVSSSGRMANIVTAVELMEAGDYFRALVSGASLPKSKPDPAIFLNSAAAVQADPSECIVIEDSMHGIEGARRAGMSCIAVGQIAASDELSQYLDEQGREWCLPMDTLDRLSWENCLNLWRQPNNR